MLYDRVNETAILEKDAKEMEIRLQSLQTKMEQQRLEDESIPRKHGSRWSGARLDKGSATNYTKDIQEKYKKVREAQGGGDPALWIQQPKKVAPKPVVISNGNIKSKGISIISIKIKNKLFSLDVKTWTSDDVYEWLTQISLNQYAGIFKANDISGSILLDISLEDLDYMEIKVLGHRKIILRGIEDLRKNKRFLGVMEQSHSAPTTADQKSHRTVEVNEILT